MRDWAKDDLIIPVVETVLECIRMKGKHDCPVDIMFDVLLDYKCTYTSLRSLFELLLRAKLIEFRDSKFFIS